MPRDFISMHQEAWWDQSCACVLILPKCQLVSVYDSYFVVHLDFICGTSRWCRDIASSVSLAWPGMRSHHKVIDVKSNWLMPLPRLTGRYWRKHGLFGWSVNSSVGAICSALGGCLSCGSRRFSLLLRLFLFHYIHKFIGYVQLPDSCNILLTEKWIVSVVERNRLSQAMSSEYVVESTDCQWL